MTVSGRRPPERLVQVDALRGVAALCVVVFHLKVMTSVPGGLLWINSALGRWGNGYLWTAVDLFFVISGFIFAHVYLREGQLAGSTTMRSYAAARVARIYPLHILMLMVVAAIAWSGAPLASSFASPVVRYDAYHFVLNLVMAQASGLERGFSFNSPAWSLTSEFVCYAIFYVLARAGKLWLIAGAVLAILVGLQLICKWRTCPFQVASAAGWSASSSAFSCIDFARHCKAYRLQSCLGLRQQVSLRRLGSTPGASTQAS